MLAELDAAGRLVCAGAGRGAAGALLAAHARLAPCPKARSAALQLAPASTSPASPASPALRLVVARELAPLDELLLWPDDALLERARVPPPPPARGDPGLLVIPLEIYYSEAVMAEWLRSPLSVMMIGEAGVRNPAGTDEFLKKLNIYH